MTTFKPRDPTPGEMFWSDLIRGHTQQMEHDRVEWDEHAAAYRSSYFENYDERGYTGNEDEDEDTVHTELNYLYPMVDSLLAIVVPPNPQVTIVTNRKSFKAAGTFREAYLNKLLVRASTAEKLWKLAARSIIFPRAFIKCLWDVRRSTPKLRVINPHNIFFDQRAESWDEVRYVIECTTITQAQFQQRIKNQKGTRKSLYKVPNDWKPTYTQHPEQKQRTDRKADLAQDSAYSWIRVYEVYDLIGKRFMHYVDGLEIPVFDDALPYQLHRNPYYMLTFNDNLEDIGGLSDAKLVFQSMQRLNELATLRMWALKTTISTPVVHTGLLDDEEEFFDGYLNLDGPGQALRLAARPNTTIGDVLGQTPTTQMSSDWQPTMDELKDMIEYILGSPGYLRGETGSSDVATDLALANEAVRTRNSRRQKQIYLVIQWVCEAFINLLIEHMPEDVQIPMKLAADGQEELADRSTLAFPPPDQNGQVQPDGAWNFNYAANPYNASEDNAVAQLKTLMQLLEFFQMSPSTDQHGLAEKLAGLIRMPEIVMSREDSEKAAAAQQQAAMAAEQGDQAAPEEGAPVDPAMEDVMNNQTPDGPTEAQLTGDAAL